MFSDKTGTLTCNIMEFKFINIKGKSYGKLLDYAVYGIIIAVIFLHAGGDRSLEGAENLPTVTNVDFFDAKFFEARDKADNSDHETVQ